MTRSGRASRSGAQMIGVVDVACAGQDREHEREEFVPGMCAPAAANEADALLDQAQELKADTHGARGSTPASAPRIGSPKMTPMGSSARR